MLFLTMQDPYAIVNTVVEEAAKKRALIDAVLSATRASELFLKSIFLSHSDSFSSVHFKFPIIYFKSFMWFFH